LTLGAESALYKLLPLTSVQHRFFRITVTGAVQRAGLATVSPAFNKQSG